MADVFVGQIVMTGQDLSNPQFARCDGALLPINQQQTLFSLLGTNYGGNGISNFALPDLRGGSPVGAQASQDGAWQPQPYDTGQRVGAAEVALTVGTMLNHNHMWQGTSSAGSVNDPTNNLHGQAAIQGGGTSLIYATEAQGNTQCVLDNTHIGFTGLGTPHPNLQPYLAVCFSIALSGVYPSR
ncbi:MAG TPA: tail fiber protein [Rhodopila sp.]|jgi:microcystin-dependent protein|nr:tail fiber protein [Rhodopila sp.]